MNRHVQQDLATDPASHPSEALGDKGTVAFFGTLARHCAQLRTLVLHYWRFHWNKPDKVLKVNPETRSKERTHHQGGNPFG